MGSLAPIVISTRLPHCSTGNVACVMWLGSSFSLASAHRTLIARAASCTVLFAQLNGNRSLFPVRAIDEIRLLPGTPQQASQASVPQTISYTISRRAQHCQCGEPLGNHFKQPITSSPLPRYTLEPGINSPCLNIRCLSQPYWHTEGGLARCSSPFWRRPRPVHGGSLPSLSREDFG